ncbi:two-component sensor histidine kinase [Ornithinimicrobium sp. Arc0846-15]|nr:two-component sensor histidine kinase [Ornithinimicrobium laminariae]
MRTAFKPLPWWAEAWRLGLSGFLAFVFVVLLVGAGPALSPDGETTTQGWLAITEPVLGLVSLLIVHWRRRWPVTVAILISVASAFSVAAGIIATLAVISLGTRRQWREIIIVAPFYVAAGQVFDRLDPLAMGSTPITTAVMGLAVYVAMVSIGAYIGARRDSANLLLQRVESAEKELASRAARARADERARIAREMHDTLAHRISLIAVHAGALSYRDDLPPAQVKESAQLLRDNADQAVRELRDVLGILRATDEPGQSHTPHNSIADLPDLIAEVQSSGTKVALSMNFDHPVDTMAASTGRHTYRVIQEALTNARKHAPGMPVAVALSGGREYGLAFKITSDAAPYSEEGDRPESSGMGLLGLTERVELAGGKLAHGTDRAGRFVVHGRLAWEGREDE